MFLHIEKKRLIIVPQESETKFVINREDHTLGNLLRLGLDRNPHVAFHGFKPQKEFQTSLEYVVSAQKGTDVIALWNESVNLLLRDVNHIQHLWNTSTRS